MDSSNNSLCQSDLGTPSPWISLNTFPSSSILVIIDHLSKQGIFIPTHDTITLLELVKLFVTHVFSKPSHVTSNRGPEFVSHFFHSLRKALDIRLHFTSGYHLKVMVRPSVLTRLWNSTSTSIATTNRTTGLTSSHLRNLLITMLQVLPLVSLLSLPTKATIPRSPSTLTLRWLQNVLTSM